MLISEAYNLYNIPTGLQQHMLRVAAGCHLITNLIPGFNQSREVITTALLHDIGNIVKVKKGELTMTPSDPLYYKWDAIKLTFIEKYGNDDHKATMRMLQELKQPDRILTIMTAMPLFMANETAESNDFSAKICFYSDKRTTPNGFASIEERMNDIKLRYPTYKGMTLGSPGYNQLIDSVFKIEEQIKDVCISCPTLISSNMVEALLPQMELFEI